MTKTLSFVALPGTRGQVSTGGNPEGHQTVALTTFFLVRQPTAIGAIREWMGVKVSEARLVFRSHLRMADGPSACYLAYQ